MGRNKSDDKISDILILSTLAVKTDLTNTAAMPKVSRLSESIDSLKMLNFDLKALNFMNLYS